MNFKDLELKPTYDSIIDDIYNDFFNKILSESTRCDRLGGVFTSRNFAACAEGMQNFIKNDGRMRLILTPSFSDDDVNAIQNGLKNENDVITKNWITELDEIKDKFEQDHTKALAWLLKNNLLDIRIAVLINPDGSFARSKDLEKIGILKRKTGIYIGQSSDEIVTFQGQVDFDDKLFGEYYHFDVYRYWDESERKWVNQNYTEFEKYWDGKIVEGVDGYNLKIITLPTALKENLIERAPPSKSEISLKKLPTLYPFQKTAISNWAKENYQGIFEMATGTGKTFTAIGGIKQLQQEIGKLLIIIACPYTTLVSQWQENLQKWNISSTVTPGNNNWRKDMKNEIDVLNFSKTDEPGVIITSYATLSNEKFQHLIQKSKVPNLLVADEVHHVGATESSKGLLENYTYRLGLTATLERHFDPQGTQLLVDYFGKTVFEYSLAKAIDDGLLTGYYYYIVSDIDLEPDEKIEYRAFGSTLAKLYQMRKNKNANLAEINEKIKNVLIRRAKIIRDAKQKLVAFKQEINKLAKVNYALIYCTENQIDDVQDWLLKRRPPIISNRITANNPKKSSDRQKIVKQLVKENLNAIVAIKVLDEGIDIPEAKMCFLLASDGNPKQFVQRRGRVLRRFMGKYKDGSTKEFAVIFDFLVMPKIDPNAKQDEINSERGIVISQLDRLVLMAKIALNKDECMAEIEKIKADFGIT